MLRAQLSFKRASGSSNSVNFQLLYSSDILSDLICSFQSGMPVDIADVIDAARVSELPPLRGLEEMISTFLFIVMLSLLFAFSVP